MAPVIVAWVEILLNPVTGPRTHEGPPAGIRGLTSPLRRRLANLSKVATIVHVHINGGVA